MTRSQVLVSKKCHFLCQNYVGHSLEVIHSKLVYFKSLWLLVSEKYRFCIGYKSLKWYFFHRKLVKRVKNGHFLLFFVTKNVHYHFQCPTKSKICHTGSYFTPPCIAANLCFQKNVMRTTRLIYFGSETTFCLTECMTKFLKNRQLSMVLKI